MYNLRSDYDTRAYLLAGDGRALAILHALESRLDKLLRSARDGRRSGQWSYASPAETSYDSTVRSCNTPSASEECFRLGNNTYDIRHPQRTSIFITRQPWQSTTD